MDCSLLSIFILSSSESFSTVEYHLDYDTGIAPVRDSPMYPGSEGCFLVEFSVPLHTVLKNNRQYTTCTRRI